MSKISSYKADKIKEDILSILYENSPLSLHTNVIAKEIARDNEFVLRLLNELKEKELVKSVESSNRGKPYLKRKKWALTDGAYSAYKGLI